MVLNLNKIRNDHLIQKLFDYINTHKLVYPDQDAFNIICVQQTCHIPSMYNCANLVIKQVIDYKKSVIFHYPGDKRYWITDRMYTEEYFEEYYDFCKEFQIESYNLY